MSIEEELHRQLAFHYSAISQLHERLANVIAERNKEEVEEENEEVEEEEEIEVDDEEEEADERVSPIVPDTQDQR